MAWRRPAHCRWSDFAIRAGRTRSHFPSLLPRSVAVLGPSPAAQRTCEPWPVSSQPRTRDFLRGGGPLGPGPATGWDELPAVYPAQRACVRIPAGLRRKCAPEHCDDPHPNRARQSVLATATTRDKSCSGRSLRRPRGAAHAAAQGKPAVEWRRSPGIGRNARPPAYWRAR